MTMAAAASSPSMVKRAGSLAWFAVRWSLFLAVMTGLLAIVALMVGPKLMGWQGIVVLSGSMEPTLQTGGVAFIKPVNADQVEIGDVLTFRRRQAQRTFVTHRVVDIRVTEFGREFITRGDANTEDDVQPVLPSQVVGTVRFDLPYVGRGIDALRNQSTYYLFMGIPALLLVLNEVYTVGTEYRKNRRKQLQASQEIEGACS